MDDELDRQLAQRTQRLHGVFGRTILSELKFTKRQVSRRMRDQRWIELYDGVFRIAGAPPTWRGDLLAAVLAGGPKAVASHRSAAALWDLNGADKQIQELMCPRWRRAKHDPRLYVHETKLLTPADRSLVDSIPVTTVERTLLDLGAVRLPNTVERAVETALRRDLTTIDELEATLRRLGRRGRNGAGVLRAILAERTVDRALTESDMEMLLLQVLRKNSLPEPVPQYEIWHNGLFIARVDLAYIDWRIALDYDSNAFHTGTPALHANSARRNKIIGAEWKPITVTWPDLKSGGREVCREIRNSIPVPR